MSGLPATFLDDQDFFAQKRVMPKGFVSFTSGMEGLYGILLVEKSLLLFCCCFSWGWVLVLRTSSKILKLGVDVLNLIPESTL